MSPRILKEGELIFYFHSHDARNEDRASVHVGKGSQDDTGDAKIWLEPAVKVARAGRTLERHELSRALHVIVQQKEFLLEAWHDYRHKAR